MSYIRIKVVMTDGREKSGECLTRDYTDALEDLSAEKIDADSRVFILDFIAHPSDFISIERIENDPNLV